MQVPSPIYIIVPLCFRMEQSLSDDAATLMHEDEAGFRRIINQPRKCLSFTCYRANHSPKEHMEMDLLLEQRRREDERDAAQLAWQERMSNAQARRDEEWREEDRKATKENTTIARHSLIIAVAIPCLTLAVSIIFEFLKPSNATPIVNVLPTPAPVVNVPVPVVNLYLDPSKLDVRPSKTDDAHKPTTP